MVKTRLNYKSYLRFFVNAAINHLRHLYHYTRSLLRNLLGFYLYPIVWRYALAERVFRLGWIRRLDPWPSKNSNSRYITALPSFEAEGIGGQFVKWNTARMLGKIHGLTFVNHPFTQSSHTPGFDWNEFLGFGNGEVKYPDLCAQGRRCPAHS